MMWVVFNKSCVDGNTDRKSLEAHVLVGWSEIRSTAACDLREVVYGKLAGRGWLALDLLLGLFAHLGGGWLGIHHETIYRSSPLEGEVILDERRLEYGPAGGDLRQILPGSKIWTCKAIRGIPPWELACLNQAS